MKKVFLRIALVLLISSLVMAIVGCDLFTKPDNGTGDGGAGDTHTHAYSEEITKAPTCTEEGVKTFTCSVEGCDKPTYTEPVAKLPHTEETLAAKAPTCTEAGLTEGKKCSACGTVLTAQQPVDATGHKFDDNYDATCNNEGCDYVRDADCRHTNKEIIPAVAPTCATAGLTEGERCKDCEVVLVEPESVDALGHKYAPTVTAPTCTEGGYTTYTCSVCGDSYKDDEVAATGHSEKTLAGKAATCTETGLTEGKQCTVCNTVTVPQETITAKGHSEKTLAGKAATCTEAGLTEGKQCTVCNIVTVPQETIKAKGHSEKTLSAVAPTCTETGLTEGKQCTVCNTVTDPQETIKAKGHINSVVVKENIKDSTCSAEGSYENVVYCSVCGEEVSRKTETIAKKAHTEVTVAAVAPTCTETGLSSGKHCSVCKEVIVAQEIVAALGHTESVIPGKPASCSATGLTDGKKCSVCNAELLAQEVIPVQDHDIRILEAEEATCIKEGKTEGKYCFECGETFIAQTSIPKAAHTYDNDSDLICNVCNTERACLHAETVSVPGKAPTCTEAGLEAGTNCKICGDTIVAQKVIPATGHKNQVKIPAVAPTCTEKGATEGVKCYTCGAVIVKPTELDAKGHTEQILAASEPSCTEEGKTEGKKCSVCNETLVEQKVIPMLDHSYSEELTKGETQHWHACTACGARSDVSDHAFTNETGRKEPTCTAEGYYILECECGATKSVPIPAPGHSYSKDWKVTDTQHWHACSCGAKADLADHDYTTETERVEATCTEDGYYVLACVCGATKRETIKSQGHSYNSVVTAPTCTEQGYTTHSCTKCDYVVVDSYVEAKDHSYVSEVTAPTCLEQGYTTHTCSACGDSYKDSYVNANGHSFESKVTAPTCTEQGYTTYTCSVCSTSKVADYIDAAGHKYDHACDADCNVCSTEREVGDHVYDNACDAKCNICQAERKVGDHVYDNDCDAKCNICDAEREVGNHVYDNACDAKCNICDAERATEGHKYDDDTDTSCNECGAIREVAPKLNSAEIDRVHDIYYLDNKDSLVLDFAANVNNISNLELAYSVKRGEEELTLDGTSYTLALGDYNENTVYETYTVTISFSVNGEAQTLEYTLKLGLYDTSAYRVENESFNKDLEGWNRVDISGDAHFGGADDKATFWGEGYPIFNVGKYFASYASDSNEASQGTLASSLFTVNSDYATYMLGGGGNHNVYITIENEDGEVLALYRNTRFADFTAEHNALSVDQKRELIGKEVFLANLVTYKIDLTAFAGQQIRFVIHDHASAGWGVVFFDELITYYESSDKLPEGAILAENLLANKDALVAELALEIAEQGDYTLASYEAYRARFAEAQALLSDIAVTQATVDAATAALTDARLALEVRIVEEVAGANKTIRLVSGKTRDIVLADYINTNGLSGITYQVQTMNPFVTCGSVAGGKFTLTAGTVSQATEATVSITVSYKGEAKLTVDLTVQISNDLAPVVYESEITKNYDIFELDNKTDITIDFSENIDNSGKLPLAYSVNGNAISGSTYTHTFGKYTDEATEVSFTVTVSYTANGEAGTISYTYKLNLKDSTEYRLENGGFENGLEGWTQVGNIGGISSDRTYWAEQIEFGLDGDKMFSAYAPGATEAAVGTLTSSSFKVGGSGFVTFKVGAMRDKNYVYVDVVDAETKQILARFYNGLWVEADLSGCKLVAYKADLSAFKGKEVFFRISDNADSGYGLFFADSFVTYYENEPEGFNAATAADYQLPGTIYDLFNGGFEMGDVQGWWNQGEIGLVTNANGYWAENKPYGKHGDFLFTGVESNGADTMREGNRGVLSSSIFEIGGTGYISFMLGGGGSDQCYIQIVNVATGEVLARYHQQAQQEAVLIQYVADLSAYANKGIFARVQVVDYASSGWGCVSFDNVVTYYSEGKALPEGAITANNIYNGSYNIVNGSFETGNLDGWNMNITEAGAHNTLGHVISSEHSADWYTPNNDRKDGVYLMTFVKPNDVENCESSRGTLTSSTFTLKKNGFVSFKFGAAGKREVRIELVRADGTVIATFYNEPADKVNTQLYSYFYQYTGESADFYFRVVDDTNNGPYGCFVIDDFRVNLESAPEGYMAAIQ